MINMYSQFQLSTKILTIDVLQLLAIAFSIAYQRVSAKWLWSRQLPAKTALQEIRKINFASVFLQDLQYLASNLAHILQILH